MDTANQLIHDLKSERPDVGQPLPAILAFLPILFVLSVVGAIAFNALSFFKLKSAEKETAEWGEKSKEVQAQKAKLASDFAAIRVEQTRATDVRNWVDGSDLIQPLILAITESTDNEKTTISELSLFRDLTKTDQIRFGIKFNGEIREQLESTLEAIRNYGYQAYQAQQTVGKDGATLDYQATLIRRATVETPIELTSTKP